MKYSKQFFLTFLSDNRSIYSVLFQKNKTLTLKVRTGQSIISLVKGQ